MNIVTLPRKGSLYYCKFVGIYKVKQAGNGRVNLKNAKGGRFSLSVSYRNFKENFKPLT